MPGFPIRIFPDQSLLTAPRDFSQSSTSFIGNIRLGIHCVPLSTFLCIDLTSNWNIPIISLLSIFKKFSYIYKLLNYCASHLRAHFDSSRLDAPRLHSSFPIVPFSLACCKVLFRCLFCDKKYLCYDRFSITPPEVLSNIRLTSFNYTRRVGLLQGVLAAFFKMTQSTLCE